MPDRIVNVLKILRRPWRIISVVLAVVFAVEVGIMLVLPAILPESVDDRTRALIDAGALTVITAPVLWWIIIGPLRRVAIAEQARAETIVSNAGDGIMTVDDDGRILSFNTAASDLFRCDPEMIIGEKVGEIVPDFDLRPTPSNQTVQLTGVRRDGSRFPLALSLAAIPSKDDPLYAAVIRDLTEARRAEVERTNSAREREALRGQQMATLAQLATGVAHEIRNPLTSIKMLIQADRARLEAGGMPTEDLQVVEQEIRRMERSVNALLDYARPSEPERKLVSLQSILARTRTLIEGRAGSQNVVLRFHDTDAAVDVSADVDQIQQLMLNLTLNALDAMPDGGTIQTEVALTNDEAVVSVSDTGNGIADDVIDRLFTPFVTNKKTGIGLGLGISRRIAEDHGGSLIGFNRPDGGACFELRLPVTSEPHNHSVRDSARLKKHARIDTRESAGSMGNLDKDEGT